MTDPGYWQMLKAETKWMRVVIGGLLLFAGWNLLEAAYLAFHGFAGEGWNYEALLIDMLWFWFITEGVKRRYWRRRALAAEEAERARLIDIALGDHADLEQVRDAMQKLNWGPLPTADDLADRFTTLVLDDGSTLKLHKDLWDEKA